MVDIQSPAFSTIMEAYIWRHNYLARWPMAGYGTTLTVGKVPEGWVASGHRQRSCD